MDIVLIGGLWLDGSTAWKDVAAGLEAHGHHAIPVTLPGQGDGNTSATLGDQVDAAVAAVDAASGQPMVVGHSASCGLAWLAADARPEKISQVALIGGFPGVDGKAYFDAEQQGPLPFLGWAEFEGPDSADLDDATKQAIEATAIPVPEGVIRGVVRLTDERRFDIPVAVICPEFSPAEARERVEQGGDPELAKVKHLTYVDIDSGHWPMFSAPAELTRILVQIAGES
jgi:pimeloyl-ACP methyl ester carboxylesterase